MSALTKIRVGNIARTDVTFVPATGSVALADVTCRIIDPAGTVTALTPTGTVDVFSAQATIADTALEGVWTVRWESMAPSPRCSAEVQVMVVASPFGAAA